jgi:hypothetical protein
MLMEPKQASQVTFGLIVVSIGLMFLAGQFDSHWALDFGRLWPMIFVILGVSRLLVRGGIPSALWFFFLGGIFLLHTHRVMTLRESWPLFIVAAGVSMMLPKRKSEEAGKVQS